VENLVELLQREIITTIPIKLFVSDGTVH